MRSIRRAAIAGATAATLVLGLANVAVAEPANTVDQENTVGNNRTYTGTSSDLAGKTAEICKKTNCEEPANGQRLFGSNTDVKQEPKWAQILLGLTYAGVIGSVLGLVIFPTYNFLVFNHMIPGIPGFAPRDNH